MTFLRQHRWLWLPAVLLPALLAAAGFLLGNPTATEIESLRVRAALGQWPAEIRLRSAAWLGNPVALRAEGINLLASNSPSENADGQARLRQAAGKGDRRAALVLGKLYFHGANGLPRNHALARPWLEQAAPEWPAADFYLALIEKHGLATAANPERAHSALTRAANAGVPHAQFLLAQAYLDGQGVVRDEAKAMQLIRLAAEQEYPHALQFLAQAYARGDYGLRRDEREANLLFALTADATRNSPSFP